MKSLLAYQFVSGIGQGFDTYCYKIGKAGGIPCFDFEDSFLGFGAAETSRMKASLRSQILMCLQTMESPPSLVAFRINSVEDAAFEDDIDFLAQVRQPFHVFVPKVEQTEAFCHVLHRLPPFAISVVAILETAEGFCRASAIAGVPDQRFRLLAFGHCDYNLNLGHFPFIHQDRAEYWEWIAFLDGVATAHGKGLLNSPSLNLEDKKGFQEMVSRFVRLSSAAGQVSLSLSQTNWIQEFAKSIIEDAGAFSCPQPTDAMALSRAFEAGKLPGKSFACCPGGLVISPQEYKAAQYLLQTQQ